MRTHSQILAVLIALAVPSLAFAEQVSIRGTFSGNIQFNLSTGVGSADGSGLASHMGLSITSARLRYAGADPGCANGFDVVHDTVITAANGDQLHFAITQQVCPTTYDDGSVHVEEHTLGYQMLDGTGRFAGVQGTGTCVCNGSADFPAGSGDGVWNGVWAHNLQLVITLP
jgi:hypothetical protein